MPGVHTHDHTCRGQRKTSDVVVTLLYAVGQDLLLTQRLAVLANLTGLQVPRIHLSLSPNTRVTGLPSLLPSTG